MNLLKKLAKKRIIQIITILCIVIGVGILWLIHWSSQPSSTTIHINDNIAPAAKSGESFRSLSSKLFISRVPANWAIRKNSDTAVLTQIVSFPSASSIDHGQVAVTIDNLPSGGLSATPEYHLRTSDATTYQPATSNLPGVSALFLDKNSGPGYTAFMVHGSRYAAISVSQFATSDEAYAQLKDVVGHWRWY